MDEAYMMKYELKFIWKHDRNEGKQKHGEVGHWHEAQSSIDRGSESVGVRVSRSGPVRSSSGSIEA